MSTVATVIADFLEEKQIEVVFGIIGSANSYIFDAITSKGYTKVVYMHHEQACVMAAGSYFRTNNKISAAIVTAGAGSANAVTGVICNWADSIPCLIISGQESSFNMEAHAELRMRGVQGFPVVETVSKIVKSVRLLTDPNLALTYLEHAYNTALSDRPGPTWIDFPLNIQAAEVTDLQRSRHENQESLNTNYDPQEIIRLLQSAHRPVIMAGHGIRLSNSKNQFQELVNKLKVPVLVTWSGIDLLEENHEYNFGCSGVYGQRCANFIVQNCDLLIVIGSRLSLLQTGYDINSFAPNAKIVMINNDPAELNKYQEKFSLKILQNCKTVISDLLKIADDIGVTTWYDRCVQYKHDFPIIESVHLEDNKLFDNSYVFIRNLSELLDEDHVIAIGQGTPLPCCHQALKIKSKQSVFASNGLGEMGNGLPSAIGAAFAAQNRQVILLDGDGSMMMNLQELQTIVGYDLPVKIVIFNNEGYLFIKHTQKMLFNGRYTGVSKETGMSLPNFKKIAAAFDIPYFNTKSHDVQEFLNHEGYAIFECFMNPEQDLVPKVKGISQGNKILAVPIEEMSPLLDIQIMKNNMLELNELSYRIRNEVNITNNSIDNSI